MEPWMSPLLYNFRHHFKDKVYFEMMIDKGEIEIAPLAYIRGRTFNDSYVIVDEAQNATIHELKTVITRLGENSKIVLMGDTDQIDTAYLDKRSNGLAIVVEKFKSSPLAAHVHLQRGVRSAIATYASKVL
jgi:PhoH-like ATPase